MLPFFTSGMKKICAVFLIVSSLFIINSFVLAAEQADNTNSVREGLHQQLLADIKRRLIAIAIELARLSIGLPPNTQGGAYPGLENLGVTVPGGNILSGGSGGSTGGLAGSNGNSGGGIALPGQSGSSGGGGGLLGGSNTGSGSTGGQANGTTDSSISSGGRGPSVSFTSAGGANQPFGGKTTEVDQSSCNCAYFKTTKITMTPAKSGLPRTVLYSPVFSKLYAFYNINQTGIYLLGSYVSNAPCLRQSGYYCTSNGTYPLISIVGTSDTGGGSQAQTNNDTGAQTEPVKEEPPAPLATPPDQCRRMGEKTYNYSAKGTGYTKENTAMEGGPKDRLGTELITLQDYLAGKGSYVSVAMDTNSFPYGSELCIPEMEQKYGRQIVFKVVDTGSAFRGTGTTRIDICTANQTAAKDGTINGMLTLVSGVQAR